MFFPTAKKGFLNEGAKAFTLIELLVVIFIISFFSAFVVFNKGKSQATLSLERTSFQIAQNIRRTEELAIAAQFFNGSYPAGGYGIRFEKSANSYVIFADVNQDGNYSEGELVENIVLDNLVTITDLLPNSPAVAIFKAPDPSVVLPGGAESISIKISATGIDLEKTISVNSLGVIEIQ
ncbi:MAG: type II secretion system protein [bacterium]|nr:type II secretion system protein [bacterium]